eukprot:UN05058
MEVSYLSLIFDKSCRNSLFSSSRESISALIFGICSSNPNKVIFKAKKKLHLLFRKLKLYSFMISLICH